MSVHKDSKFVKCPFFKGHDTQKGLCEGVENGCTVYLAFVSRSNKDAYMHKRCNSDFQKCQIYRINDLKYDICGRKINS